MVTPATIATATGVADPDIDTILRYLEEKAFPVAEARNPLKVVSPVVNRLHSRARTLQFDLTASNLTPERLKTAAARAFSKSADHYEILAAIAPPLDPVQRTQFDREIVFARKLLAICLRLLKEVGGKPTPVWEVTMIPEGRREAYSAELKVLRNEYKVPAFAMKHNMARRSEFFGGIGWLVMLIFILGQTGVLGAIVRAVIAIFTND